MNRCGFSWNRLLGVSAAQARISRQIVVPWTRSDRQLHREDDKNQPWPLSWEEQDRLFAELPPYLRRAALFAVNIGCRDQEVCHLHWKWERPVPQLGISVFIIPADFLKEKGKGVKN
jgi:hypothetical protein